MSISRMTYERVIAAYPDEDALFAALPDEVAGLWQNDYTRSFPKAELLEVNTDAGGASFTYMFDYTRSRAIGAWGEPIYSRHARDAARMRGAPLGTESGTGYHRGHLIAHSIGGGMDINLVPQLGRINIGDFRVLERLARDLADRGTRAFYFVRTIYNDDSSQMPSEIEQGLVSNGFFDYALHPNQ